MKNKELVELLIEKKLHITTCESCTGGLIASALVDIAGSSAILNEAYVTYAASSKVSLVGVENDLIEKYGVVSEEVAKDMALKASIKAKSELAISSTGVAGPSGGSIETPVGCVCFGFKVFDSVYTVTKKFSGSRNEVRSKAQSFAIDYMYDLVTKLYL